MGDSLIVARIYDMMETGEARFRDKHGRSSTASELDDFVLSDDEIKWRRFGSPLNRPVPRPARGLG
jgi:hypothetical protein